jgi:hypothetical protein
MTNWKADLDALVEETMAFTKSVRVEPPKNRSTMTAYQKLVRSPSATLRASSDPITPFSLQQ